MARNRSFSVQQASEIVGKWDAWSEANKNEEGKSSVSSFVKWLGEQGVVRDLDEKPFDNNNVGTILKEAGRSNMRTRGSSEDKPSKAARPPAFRRLPEKKEPSQLDLLMAAFKPSVEKPEVAPPSKSERHKLATKLDELELEIRETLAQLKANEEALNLSLNHVKRIQEMNAKEERSVETLEFMLANPGSKTPEEREEDAEARAAQLDTSSAQVESKHGKKGKK